MRRIIIAVIVIVLFVILFSACRPAQARPCRYADGDQQRPAGDDVHRRGGTDSHLEGLVWVGDGQGVEAAEVVGGSSIDLADPERVAALFNEWHCPGHNRGLTSDDLDAVVSPDNEAWQAVLVAGDLVELPEGVTVEEAIERLEDFQSLPVQLLGSAGHWGAMPGVAPVEVGRAGPNVPEPTSAADETGPDVVAIVDTGFYGHAGVIKGAGLLDAGRLPEPGTAAAKRGEQQHGLLAPVLHRVWQGPIEGIDDYRSGSAICDVSHGEFVADLMKRVDPDVTLYGFNAFPTRLSKNGGEARCWETSELAVAFTLARMEASGVQFDAVNMSLGTYPHGPGDEQVPMPALDAILGGPTPPAWTDRVYAASGNQLLPSTGATPIPVYPANYESVVAVGAMAETREWMLWDDVTPVPDKVANAYPWVDLVVPGCSLLGRAGPDPEILHVWSGSSFASPLAAIHGLVGSPGSTGATVGLEYDDLAEGMVLAAVGGPIPDPGHCPRR